MHAPDWADCYDSLLGQGSLKSPTISTRKKNEEMNQQPPAERRSVTLYLYTSRLCKSDLSPGGHNAYDTKSGFQF